MLLRNKLPSLKIFRASKFKLSPCRIGSFESVENVIWLPCLKNASSARASI
ncbi:hypothetical protein Fmac_002706 [Flemingia macrophylla]|uniref:Uncharacterized protein n=1 Tax=Flemingia macrophylla TaxID=520843 RepID=A0ABD1NLC2_9FABA